MDMQGNEWVLFVFMVIYFIRFFPPWHNPGKKKHWRFHRQVTAYIDIESSEGALSKYKTISVFFAIWIYILLLLREERNCRRENFGRLVDLLQF